MYVLQFCSDKIIYLKANVSEYESHYNEYIYLAFKDSMERGITDYVRRGTNNTYTPKHGHYKAEVKPMFNYWLYLEVRIPIAFIITDEPSNIVSITDDNDNKMCRCKELVLHY